MGASKCHPTLRFACRGCGDVSNAPARRSEPFRISGCPRAFHSSFGPDPTLPYNEDGANILFLQALSGRRNALIVHLLSAHRQACLQVRIVLGVPQGGGAVNERENPLSTRGFFTLTGKLAQTCAPSVVTTEITLSTSADGETQTRKEGGLLTMVTHSLHSFQTHAGTFSNLPDSPRPHPMTVHGTGGGET